MSKNPSRGTCYDCGAILTKENRSSDHIPPLCMFDKTARNCDLITVPCCKECNGRHSQEDAQLMYFAMDDRAQNVEEIRERIGRSLRKGALRPSFATATVFRRRGYVKFRTTGDLGALCIRMAKGLMYQLDGLRDHHDLKFDAGNMAPEEFALFRKGLGDPAHSILKGGETFKALNFRCVDKDRAGIWSFEFHQSTVVVLVYEPADSI